MSDNHAILLVSCADQPGIVASIAQFVFSHGGNIVYSDQHTDFHARSFYMRVEWQLDGFRVPRAEVASAFAPLAETFGMRWRILFSQDVANVALFVSRHDHCLWDVLLRHRAGELIANIPVIISNHEERRSVAETFGIAFEHVPVTAENKARAEDRMLEILERHAIDVGVLARYMQVLSPAFVKRYEHRLINVHHSFLPAFTGARPYHQAYERGVKLIGATSHYVTDDLDQGPIIDQEVLRTSHRDSVDDLVRKGRDLEKLALSRALGLHLQHRILVIGRKTVIFD